MRAEAVPGGIQVTWKNGRVALSAGGTVDGQAEEGNGLSRDDPRTPTWQGARPQLPGTPPAWSQGLAMGERLAVAWAETQATSYRIKLGFFDRQGALVGGPYDVADTSGGTTDVPMGLASYRGGVAVFWVDKPSSKVSWTLVANCS
jgi:hypothetical protein